MDRVTRGLPLSAPRPFHFSRDWDLPYRDPDSGIAFGKAGMRGVYQVGVAHAFALSGYYPTSVAGTSSGALAATVLAAAAEHDAPEDALAVVADFARAWLENPGQQVLDRITAEGGGPRLLARDALDMRLTLDDAVNLAAGFAQGERRLSTLARALWALPWSRPRVWKAAARVMWAALVGTFRGDRSLRAAQALLSAYGLRKGLVQTSVVDLGFAERLRRHAPVTLGGFEHTAVVFQATDVRKRKARVVDLWCEDASLEAALRAAWAVPPLFPAVEGEQVNAHDDALYVDAAGVEKAPLAPLIKRWRASGHPARRRVFVVYTNPVGASPEAGRLADGFFGPGLHALHLSGQRDLEFNEKVVRLVTRMLDALPEDEAPPVDAHGAAYLRVDTSGIAPNDFLPLGALGVPRRDALEDALAAGCRAGLTTLHADTLRHLGASETRGVPCARLREKLRTEFDRAPDGFFQPAEGICGRCDGELYVVGEPETRDFADQRSDQGFEAFSSARAHHREGLTIAVAAGGVFRGVFQAGVIAGLAAYNVRPDLYASASVGTIFSFLLEAALRDRATFHDVVRRMRTLPAWIDLDVHGGRVDRLRDGLRGRWLDSDLRGLRIRAFFDQLSRAEPEPATAAAVRALLFTPLRDRITDEERSGLPPAPSWPEIHEGVKALVQLRLEEALPLLDNLAAQLDLFDPGEAVRGEAVGLDNVEGWLSESVFRREHVTLQEWARRRDTRFLFTVTNHTQGKLEHFGSIDADGQETPVWALEACLAASSFPLAFRRRPANEVISGRDADRPLYADGGILNNFPSDSAFAYLRRLSGVDGYRWLGEREHRVLLLGLRADREPPGGPSEGCLVAAARTSVSGDEEKVRRTIAAQATINRIAERANPRLRERGEPQAIRARLVPIEPRYDVYAHPFAFKRYLGFDEGKQLEMVAAGCRRARVALAPEAPTLPHRARPAPRTDRCILAGTPSCPFHDTEHTEVQTSCYATAWKDRGE